MTNHINHRSAVSANILYSLGMVSVKISFVQRSKKKKEGTGEGHNFKIKSKNICHANAEGNTMMWRYGG